jgi:flagellar hook protein FlgE
MEAHVVPATDIVAVAGKVNGQIAVGTVEFNGDGSLRAVSAELTSPITINWTNGSVASTITLDLGTAGQPFGTAGATLIGRTDGLSQFDSAYNLSFINQNGSPVGELVGIAFDEEGFVIASYSNGETQRIYKLAIADFNNPNGLKSFSGNVFAQAQASGEVNLREAGKNGVGSVAPSSLESSNVDLSEQLTDMIVAQRAYQANTRVITTTDRLLEELNGLVR